MMEVFLTRKEGRRRSIRRGRAVLGFGIVMDNTTQLEEVTWFFPFF